MAEHWCPRRAEVGALPGPNGEPPRFFPDGDSWRDAGRTCSYCGSMHPDDFMAYVERGEEVAPTDKSYKAYARGAGAGAKFYFQHLSDEQRRRFVYLMNAGKIKLGHPGRFYVMPFFVRID